MHLGDVARRRRKPAADRPHRLVGNDKVRRGRAIRHGAVELRAHDRKRAPAVAFAAGLADADDGAQSRPARGQSLALHIAIGFPVIAAPLRMADDDGAGAGVLEHFRREVAGERACRLGMAVLGADPHRTPRSSGGEFSNQCRGRAYQDIDRGEFACTHDDSGKLRHRGPHAVHLPIARNERTPWHASHLGLPAFSVSGQAVSRAPGATPGRACDRLPPPRQVARRGTPPYDARRSLHH
jgi:hypothetical protein